MEIRKQDIAISRSFYGRNSNSSQSGNQYQERDIANSANPVEYLGRSQVVHSRSAFVSPISSKALAVLLKNNIITTGFVPETTIASDVDSYSSMPIAFQRKLAIDMMNEPQQRKNIYNENGDLQSRVTIGEFGKPTQIDYYDGTQLTHSVTMEYAQKQDGSYVLVKETMIDKDAQKENVITYYKHKNGAVTISSTDGRQMSYSLRHETIRDYQNTTTVTTPANQIPLAEPESVDKVKLFCLQKPQIETREYTNAEKQFIELKFSLMQKDIDSRYSPTDEYAFRGNKSVSEGLKQIKELVLNTKDYFLQKKMLELLSTMKSNVPTDYVGSYARVDINAEYANPEFIKMYALAKISAYLEDKTLYVDKNNIPCSALEDKLPYTGSRYNLFSRDFLENTPEIIEGIKSSTTLSETEKAAEIQSVLDTERYNMFADAAWDAYRRVPELREYLNETYLKSMLPDELQQDLTRIQQATGNLDAPKEGSNFRIEDLKNFNKMSDVAKRNYLKHPDLLMHVTLYESNGYGGESPYQVLSNLTEEEWQIFDNRGMGKVIDLIAGYNILGIGEGPSGAKIRDAISMSDEEWQKIEDFGFFNLRDEAKGGYRENSNMMFTFSDIQYLIENMSYQDWDIAKQRGLIGMKSTGRPEPLGLNNYGSHIGVDIISALAKVPNSTFSFLKNNMELIKDDMLNASLINVTQQNQVHVAKGIEFLSRSHNDVYQHMQKLKDNGIPPYTCMELLGLGSKQYGRFGNYMTNKAIELKDKIVAEHCKNKNSFLCEGVISEKLPKLFPMYLDLQSIKGKSNINELTIEEKRALLKNIIKYNADLFSNGYYLFDSPIVPKNKEEYCTLVPKLVKAIGIDTREVSKETIANFETALNKMAEPDSEFMNITFTRQGPKLALEYPRSEFIVDILEKTAELSDAEKNKVYDYFGFDLIQDKNGVYQLHGYPININNGAKMAEIEDDNTKAVVETVRPLVERFTNSNKVTIDGMPELTQQMNDILALFPEFKTVIGKEQHGTHHFSIDIHTLKVLQGVMSDPRYKALPDKDKKLLNIATLLHDLTKAEKLIDKTHPAYSAYDAYHILDKMDLSEADRIEVYQIIKNHDWFEKYNTPVRISSYEARPKTPAEKLAVAKDVAFELKDENNFLLASILTRADMNAVTEDDSFFRRFGGDLDIAEREITALVDDIQSTAIHLPQTKIPKASELVANGDNIEIVDVQDDNGESYQIKVLKVKKGTDLGQYGFEKGLLAEDLNVICHAFDYAEQGASLQALGSIDSDSLLSTSYVNYKKGNFHLFRPQGFILDVASSDIQAGSYMDFGSGYKKDLDGLKSDYLFKGKRKFFREYMSKKMKEALRLSDEEYKTLYSEIANKSITDLDKSHPKIANTIREIFDSMEIHKRRHGRNYNEWLVSRPKIQGVFVSGQQYEYRTHNIPKFLAKYANDNDLPVIMFCD